MDESKENPSEHESVNSLDKEFALALDLSYQAGELVQKIRTNGFQVYNKGPHLGLVTDADKAASKFIVEKLTHAFPDDIIISEEEPLPQKNSAAKRIWFIDPIDGTKDFVTGSREWSIMLGLAINGTSHLGIVYQPDANELYYAIKSKGACHIRSQKTTPIRTRSISDPTKAILIQSRNHWSSKAQQIAKQFGINKTFQYGSIGLKLGKIATGEADLYFNFSGHCHLWDLCGPQIILQEAGGKVLLSSGKPIIYSQGETIIKDSFLAANKALADKIYPVLKQGI
ncbi:3'(2'),5'-bisphosphate nucleotidase CysQ family protein [Legionella cardiaca]|uniref:3'(2'),5'-bisphosphate nucleotidase CysQ n=1 Tax=Legionella cardiaca TaxID=1071983 RepID=A0ABY8AWA1_9GAMM|nr:3'(2'),5'-bisphosphate nucleotidase CysQ [Legionella cardiaca]WED44019.1 3'(2'),5'-bisphosphate nucleotidase CysQ [Legionella cardiaca]